MPPTSPPTPPTASDAAFSASVKAVQTERGSRAAFARRDETGGWPTVLSADLAAFLGDVRSFYLATASADGQPYVQHRGGPPGFLRGLHGPPLAFDDFKGNRQFLTTGNLRDNPRAFIFIMDYARCLRVKLWGRARVVTDDAALAARLWPDGYKARPEQVIAFELATWDTNCNQHIPQLFPAEDVAHTITTFQARIRELEAEVAALKAAAAATGA